MTLALHPTSTMPYVWRGAYRPTHNQAPVRPTCQVCRYELIAGWCSRCDLEENGVLV